VTTCTHRTEKHFGQGGEVCGRPAVCWWQPWQYCQDPPEPRCELHSRGGVVVAEMRGEEE
jgi:hypothetical protein